MLFVEILLAVAVFAGWMITVGWLMENDHGWWAVIIAVIGFTLIIFIAVHEDQKSEEDCHNAGGVRVKTGEHVVSTGKSVIVVPEYTCATAR